eukprot:CAMPEP_0184645522 /NCGR_PEP_ID=MMETSP0308-20130426/2045_1 /TAXON_ID=38269 /ORGANISM="Gloeochaete witrockiana, Strain SAG 46.84" /LENGTH=169 /DNA_ID=CAMNT_0027074645 /DNA_START=353 /DNA_END=862 /DNA_ORIENTATION=+
MHTESKQEVVSQQAPLTETSAEATSSEPAPSDVHPERKKVQVSLERLARYDAREANSEYIFWVELPGVDSNNIKLQVEKRVLEIEGTREDSTDTVDAKIVFTRKFRLPETVNVEQIRASLEQGVLTINVPKALPVGAFRVPITALPPASSLKSSETVSSKTDSQEVSNS